MKDGKVASNKLDLEFIARIKNEDGTVVERTVTLKDALPGLDDFDLCTMEGFTRDTGTLETALIKGRAEIERSLSQGFLQKIAEKKTQTMPRAKKSPQRNGKSR